MYVDFKFDPSPRFQDDLKNKPLMQQLWAGSNLYAPESSINKPSDSLALLLGCNSFVDHEIGRILDLIQKKCPNALVIFTSDHGDMLGAHRLFSKNAAVYREVTNIPLIMPLCKPVATTVIIMETIWAWNAFMLPLVLTLNSPASRTLAVGLYAFKGENTVDWTSIAAGGTIAIIPVIILFIFMQRHFVEGIAGAVKS